MAILHWRFYNELSYIFFRFLPYFSIHMDGPLRPLIGPANSYAGTAKKRQFAQQKQTSWVYTSLQSEAGTAARK
jgi:hypothetical protein